MTKKEGLNFSYDEHTNVPTFQEVSSVMSKSGKDKKNRKKAKPIMEGNKKVQPKNTVSTQINY